MDNSNLHHRYMDRVSSSQRLGMRPPSPNGPREMYGSDMQSHSHRFGSVQSASGLLHPSELCDDRHLQYHGLMSSAYASSSLPSQGALNRNYHSHPVNAFNEQYNQLQQARMQQQMKTQSDALQKQQQTFAMRQKLNPPTMSRQASAINLNQSHISTQTTSSVQCSPTLHQPSTSMPQQQFASPRKSPRPDQLKLQHDQQQLFRALQNDLRAHLRQQNTSRTDENPFSDDIRTEREQGAQSPVHQTLAYKSEQLSSSSATSSPTKLLKSPKTKRQPTALVTFSGWLYKQGSDGLRVWRKRWFVLTEYCLFYYKGPEEDKLLGSILLPSYTLSECLPHENKAYRRFSFKLEHKNMRTYYLASENGDYMRKWMRVIRAATLMQNLNEVQMRQMIAQSTPINTSLIAHADEPDPRSFSYAYSHSAANPNNNPFLNANDDPNERQPLYANAPPKPRRTHNDVDYSAFATEMMLPFQSEYNADAIPDMQESQPEPLSPKTGSNRLFSEYEEIYNAQENQLKNMSLNPYGASTLNRPNAKSFALNDYSHELNIDTKAYQRPKPMPPRPRSADFLEYESKKQMRKMANMGRGAGDPFPNRLPSRPKSSLDINSSVDNYYYSEASYAAKMRQSAQYLQSRNVMRPQSATKDEFNRNTLRYENERKRLTSEFQSYTAAAAAANKTPSINTNSLPSNFQRGASDLRLTDEWKFSPLKRKSVYSADERSMMYRDDISSSQSFSNPKFLSGDAVSSPSTPDRHFPAEHLQSFGGSSTLPKAGSSGKSHSVDRSDQSVNSIWNPDISAGALLSKTHEELILLLIQLRRQNDAKERAIKRGYSDIEAIQERLNTGSSATATRLELMSRLEILREQMNKVEKQYEKNKPLVNLVDNMVKLGALYRTESLQWNASTMASKDDLNRLHANQRNQEHLLMAEDQNEWNKYNSRQIELHQKVQQLYELDEILQEESDNLHLLQRDKEDIEGALAELNRKFATDRVQPESFVTTKKIQHSLEAELSKIHHQLAINSRKLEQTVSGNSRLERELLVLRQKLQASRSSGKPLKSFHHASSTNDCTTDAFDSELQKVQSLVGDMQRQRQELSFAVNQLTMNSNSFAKPTKASSGALPAHKPTADTLPSYLNKRLHSNWTETDLDSMYSKNYGSQLLDTMTSGDLSDNSQNSSYHSQATAEAMHTLDAPEYAFSNDLFPYQDKQEIKTVRIVKRESERRQRDKDKSGGPLIGSNVFDHIAEFQTSDELNEYLSGTYTGEPRIGSYSEDDALMSDDELCLSPSGNNAGNFIYGVTMGLRTKSNARVESALENISIDRGAAGGCSSSTTTSAPLTDHFQSNAARQIHNELSVTTAPSTVEMSKQQLTDMANQYKRSMPRKKKRHNTAPNSMHNEIFNDYLAAQNSSKQNNYRARDDLDMEVALRTNVPNIASGAPDIVRSALGQSNDYLWPK